MLAIVLSPAVPCAFCPSLRRAELYKCTAVVHTAPRAGALARAHHQISVLGDCGERLPERSSTVYTRDDCRWCRLYGLAWWTALLLAAASLLVTLYGERHYAEEIQALQPLLKDYTPSPCSPLPQNDGKLIHIDCPITAMDLFYPPAAFAPNLSQFSGIFFEIRVEMFQHVHKIGAVGPYFFAQWADHLALILTLTTAVCTRFVRLVADYVLIKGKLTRHAQLRPDV
ncbi:unnamed protein product, partial [Rangifer tarandus platyrhynchus]